jgi:hypothetical protein
VSTQSYWTHEIKKVVNFDEEVSYQIKYILWFNPLNINSLRLTSTGFNYFSNRAKLTFYKHCTSLPLKPKTLLQIEKNFTYPYYIIDLKTISISDAELSSVLLLYSNNLQQYLDNIDLLK